MAEVRVDAQTTMEYVLIDIAPSITGSLCSYASPSGVARYQEHRFEGFLFFFLVLSFAALTVCLKKALKS